MYQSKFGNVVQMGGGFLISPYFYEALEKAKRGDFGDWKIIYDVFSISLSTQEKWRDKNPEDCVREAVIEIVNIEASDEWQLKKDARKKAFQEYLDTGHVSDILK